MAELADALDLGSSAFGRGGSSPPSRTSDNAGQRVFLLACISFFVACAFSYFSAYEFPHPGRCGDCLGCIQPGVRFYDPVRGVHTSRSVEVPLFIDGQMLVGQ